MGRNVGRHRGLGHYKNSAEAMLSSNPDEQGMLHEGNGILVPSRPDDNAVSADEILAKYRSKPRSNENELSTSNEVILSTPFNGT